MYLDGETPSVIGEDLTIEGQAIIIRCKGALKINGKIHAELHSQKLVVGKSGQVEGTIAADSVDIWGTVSGTIMGARVTLHPSAEVEGDECVCVLEQVGGFVGKGQPGSAMFKFGEHFGFIKGVVQTLGIKLVLVRPQTWQKDFGLGTAANCASKSDWKNKLKAEAQRRFPHLPVTLATADALLILEWHLRQFQKFSDGDLGLQPMSDNKTKNKTPVW